MALVLIVVIWIGIDLLAMNLCIRMGVVPSPGKRWTPHDERQLARWARSQR
jgi:hypothetical protein